MAVHLLKLFIDARSPAELAAFQARRLAELAAAGRRPELVHLTRSVPRRAAELLDGGSIYWVLGGVVAARQRMLALRPAERGGAPCCALVFDRDLIPVEPRPHRPFQGWRYLRPEDAPPDSAPRRHDGDLPDTLRRDLARLGL